jgi:hypothetical protein
MKTSELINAALDWAVAEIEWVAHDSETNVLMVTVGDDNGWKFKPSSNWSQGGLIIEREGIQIKKHASNWIALPVDAEFSEEAYQEGDTPLIAAMRCYVASKLGDEIELPEGLTHE